MKNHLNKIQVILKHNNKMNNLFLKTLNLLRKKKYKIFKEVIYHKIYKKYKYNNKFKFYKYNKKKRVKINNNNCKHIMLNKQFNRINRNKN